MALRRLRDAQPGYLYRRPDAVDRWNVNWGWQVVNYRIQHRLNTFVLERRTTGYRDDFVVQERADAELF